MGEVAGLAVRMVLDERVDGEQVDGELDVRLLGEVGAPMLAGFVVDMQRSIVPRPAAVVATELLCVRCA